MSSLGQRDLWDFKNIMENGLADNISIRYDFKASFEVEITEFNLTPRTGFDSKSY
jgi:hypothetical protein